MGGAPPFVQLLKITLSPCGRGQGEGSAQPNAAPIIQAAPRPHPSPLPRGERECCLLNITHSQTYSSPALTSENTQSTPPRRARNQGERVWKVHTDSSSHRDTARASQRTPSSDSLLQPTTDYRSSPIRGT